MTRAAYADPTTLMRIKNLQLRAKHVVDGFQSGLHRSPLHGFSVEFSEYRPFVSGEDPRSVDWKLFARSDRYYVKNAMRTRPIDAVTSSSSQSLSMAYGSLSYTKLDYTRTLAATLAYWFNLQRDAVGSADLRSRIHRLDSGALSPRTDAKTVVVAGSSARWSLDRHAETADAAGEYRQTSRLIVVQVGFFGSDRFDRAAAGLSGRSATRADLLRILDPNEVQFSLKQPVVLRELEGGREMYVDPASASKLYRERFDRHAGEMSALAGRLGGSLMTITTDRPLEASLWICCSDTIDESGVDDEFSPPAVPGRSRSDCRSDRLSPYRREAKGEQLFGSLMFLEASPPTMMRRSRLIAGSSCCCEAWSSCSSWPPLPGRF